MFTNIRNRFIPHDFLPPARVTKVHKFEYKRPDFLQLLTQDELKASADHNIRPIIVPRDIHLLPWGTGYAECVNSGKSTWNEDQADFRCQVLSDPTHQLPNLPYTYFGIFDGHAGYGAALAASHQFHHILHEKLVDCLEILLRNDEPTPAAEMDFPHPRQFQYQVTKDDLIVGALESAFFDMDKLIDQDTDRYINAGGCTACVALFINGKLFVANAGDSRAVLCHKKIIQENTTISNGTGESNENDTELGTSAEPMSFDHTPETERDRLLNIAQLKPHLIEGKYAAMDYAQRPRKWDLGRRVLCRKDTMKGWTYKIITKDDIRMPVVSGTGKRSRLLGTLGVTRGFGDHELMSMYMGIQIKPFLTPHPDVQIRDLTKVVSIPDEHNEDGDYGILVMATDGLWDVSENEIVSETVFKTLAKYPTEKHRYTMTAQELVARARGKVNNSGHWRLGDSKAAATVDDISVIVIPVYQYYKQHMEWVKNCETNDLNNTNHRDSVQSALEAEEIQESDMVALVNGLRKTQLNTNTDNVHNNHIVNSNNVNADLDDDDDEEILVEVTRIETKAIIEEEPVITNTVENISTEKKHDETAETNDLSTP